MATLMQAVELLQVAELLRQRTRQFVCLYEEKGPNKQALLDFQDAVCAMESARHLRKRSKIEQQVSRAADALERAFARLA